MLHNKKNNRTFASQKSDNTILWYPTIANNASVAQLVRAPDC